jgi:hypothetical protein
MEHLKVDLLTKSQNYCRTVKLHATRNMLYLDNNYWAEMVTQRR